MGLNQFGYYIIFNIRNIVLKADAFDDFFQDQFACEKSMESK